MNVHTAKFEVPGQQKETKLRLYKNDKVV